MKLLLLEMKSKFRLVILTILIFTAVNTQGNWLWSPIIVQYRVNTNKGSRGHSCYSDKERVLSGHIGLSVHQGPIVQKLVNAKPGVKSHQGFCFSCLNAFPLLII